MKLPRKRELLKHHPDPLLGWNRSMPLPKIFKAWPDMDHLPTGKPIDSADRRMIVSTDGEPITRDTRPVAIDLFSGAGGFSLGLVQAGFQIVAAIELDYWCTITYCFNIPSFQAAPLYMFRMPVEELSGTFIKEVIGLEEIDVVVGGPPCQSFSTAGKRRVGDERDDMVFEFTRLCHEINPKTFVMENVPAIMSKKDPDGRLIVDELTNYIETGKRNKQRTMLRYGAKP